MTPPQTGAMRGWADDPGAARRVAHVATGAALVRKGLALPAPAEPGRRMYVLTPFGKEVLAILKGKGQ